MLDVSEYNLAGRRAYEKAGFREIGRRRQADPLAGTRYDLIFMDCLASDFRAEGSFDKLRTGSELRAEESA
jgi:RimJ/RimL family protein N-acetyltransferase